MDATDLAFAGAAAQAELIRTREVSARDVVQATLDRIADVDTQLNSYCQVFPDHALLAAAALDDGPPSDKPLAGVPIAIPSSGSPATRGITAGHPAVRVEALAQP